MNTGKKIIMALAIGLNVIPCAYGDVSQLDDKGRAIVLKLANFYKDFTKTLVSPHVQFNFGPWNYVLESDVNQYVGENGRVLGILDGDLSHYFNLLLQVNKLLFTTIKAVQAYKKPARPLNETDFNLLTEQLLKPFEKINENLQNTIIPKVEKLTFYANVQNKKKAQALLVSVFDLQRLIAKAMINYTATIIYKD